MTRKKKNGQSYSSKLKRKKGSGPVDPAWKWWLEPAGEGAQPRPMGAPRPQPKPRWYDSVMAGFE